MQKEKEKAKETESKETFLSDFGKLSMSLSREVKDRVLERVGRMQKEDSLKKPKG